MDFDEIKQIVQLMQENDLSEFELEREGFRIVMRKAKPEIITHHSVPIAAPQVIASGPGGEKAEKAAPEEDENYEVIKSPMVGTFYTSPSPDSDPYVRIGDQVGEDTVVCILEAMKVMNEIKAEVRGKIVDILVENAEPVEYGQALFKVDVR